MPKTKTRKATKPDQPYETGPGAGATHVAGTCDRCGRGELVKSSVTVAEGQQLLDTAGDEVKDGAHVTVCALCGAVQSTKTFKEGGRTAKAKTPAKRKRKTASAKRKTASAKRSPAKRSSTSRNQRAAVIKRAGQGGKASLTRKRGR